MSNQTSGKEIAKNTLFLYARLLITILVSLYTARIVLNTLGVDDFGLFNVVGGVVAMFSFLNAGMVQASQRFMSYEIGKSDYEKLRNVFSTTLYIHVLIAVIVIIGVESIGVWFLNEKMNITPDRMYAANWVLQCCLLSFAVGVITVPFNAAIIAHERMGIYAFVSIVDAILRLAIVFVVKYSSFDKLVLYSILLLIIPIAEFVYYSFYCKKKFEEVSLKPKNEKTLFRNILSFAGWSFVGNVGFIFRSNGVNIVVNLFCGTAVNAARGIAYQISSQIVGFASNFQMAVIPQITKRYAANDYTNMISLVIRGSKYSFILLYILALPFCLRANYVLTLWLGNVPHYTLEFVTLILIMSMIDGMAIPLGKAIDATGNIKWFQISVALVMLLDIPFAYILLTFGVKPYLVVAGSIVVSLIGLALRLYLIKRRFDIFPIVSYIKDVILKNFTLAAVLYIICNYINHVVDEGFVGFLLICVISVVTCAGVFYRISLTMDERKMIFSIITTKLHIKK